MLDLSLGVISPLEEPEKIDYTQNFFLKKISQFFNFQFFIKSKVYALHVHVLKICGKFEVNSFNSFREILHKFCNFENMISRKSLKFKFLSTIFQNKQFFIFLYTYIINVPSC